MRRRQFLKLMVGGAVAAVMLPVQSVVSAVQAPKICSVSGAGIPAQTGALLEILDKHLLPKGWSRVEWDGKYRVAYFATSWLKMRGALVFDDRHPGRTVVRFVEGAISTQAVGIQKGSTEFRLLADGRTVFLFQRHDGNWYPNGFGEFDSYKGEVSRYGLLGRALEQSS
jgi:hypothetical protein